MYFNVILKRQLPDGRPFETSVPMIGKTFSDVECILDELTDLANEITGVFPDPYDPTSYALWACGKAVVSSIIEKLNKQSSLRKRTFASHGINYTLALAERRHLQETLDKCIQICADTVALFLHMEDKTIFEEKYNNLTVIKEDASDPLAIYQKIIPLMYPIITEVLSTYPLTDDTIEEMKTHILLDW